MLLNINVTKVASSKMCMLVQNRVVTNWFINVFFYLVKRKKRKKKVTLIESDSSS